jgi:hypothetical protein
VAVDDVESIVPKESAIMLPHPNSGIDANHMDMTKFTSSHDAGFINLQGVLDDWIKRYKSSKASDKNSGHKETASAAAMTFSNGPIMASTFQQGTGNAARDINHGNVTNQSAGRDWINRDKRTYTRSQCPSNTDENILDDSE